MFLHFNIYVSNNCFHSKHLKNSNFYTKLITFMNFKLMQ